jgi:hypothetical protein
MLRNPATRKQALDVLQGEHSGIRGAAVNLASVIAADRIVDAIAPKQKPVAKETETGVIAGTLTGLGKEAIRNTASIKAAARGSITAATIAKGATTALAGAAAEIPGAVAGIVAGSETTRALRNKLDEWDPDHNVFADEAGKDIVADAAGGFVGGAAAAVATDAVIATAGVGAALVTGTEVGAAVGTVGGPVGWAVGAGAGALVGLGIWAISSIFGG